MNKPQELPTEEEQQIPFNRPYIAGRELEYIADAQQRRQLAGHGPFTDYCQVWLEQATGSSRVLLTHSCTASLEMAAQLLDIRPGQEVIMPSYTFPATANAFVRCGATPVFVDVRDDTLNIDERQIQAAVSSRTRAIVPVHYAGVGCEMDSILQIAETHGLQVVEDAAQGFDATYNGRALGTMGQFGALSFQQTKNVISGEGGALLINTPELIGRAEMILDNGTDRGRYLRGEVDSYTWQEAGSSYLPGELVAAFLCAQLEAAEIITRKRMEIWRFYHAALLPLETRGLLRRPCVPQGCTHNAHTYFVRLAEDMPLRSVLDHCLGRGVVLATHYAPLHSSPAGRKYARVSGTLPVTESLPQRLLRLPVWPGIQDSQLCNVVEVLTEALENLA